MNEKRACRAVLSDTYVRYLDLCVPKDADQLSLSVEDCHFKGREQERFEVLQIGDGTTRKIAYVRTPEGKEMWLQLHRIRVVEGSLRDVKKRGLIKMGKTSLMGCVAHGILSGKAFRGR